jgi:hypothetical protein
MAKMKFGKAFLLAISITVAASTFAVAGSPSGGHASGFPVDEGGYVKTTSALFEWADPIRDLPAGTNVTINPSHELYCDTSAGCVAFVQTTVQIASVAAGKNEWIVCAEVDNNATDPTECFQGVTNSTNITQGVYNGSLKVNKGEHRFKIIVTATNEATLFDWHMAAQMLK